MRVVKNKEIPVDEFIADLNETLNEEEELLRRFHDGEKLTEFELKRAEKLEEEFALELSRALHKDLETPKKPRQ